MPDNVKELFKYAPVVALLLFAFWAGYRGWWYWGKNAREVIRRTEAERDAWRDLAMALLRKQGIEVPIDIPSSVVRAYTDEIKKREG